MSSFPPADWEARYQADWPTFNAVQPDVAKTQLTALLAVRYKFVT